MRMFILKIRLIIEDEIFHSKQKTVIMEVVKVGSEEKAVIMENEILQSKDNAVIMED